MRRYTSVALLLLAVCLCIGLFCGCTLFQSTESQTASFTVTFYKIGKADAALLYLTDGAGEDFSVLIDTGEADDGREIIDKVRADGITSLDYLLLTHFDKDHIGGVPQIIEALNPKQILMPDYVGEGDAYTAMASALEGNSATQILKEDASFSFGNVSFFVSTPKCAVYDKKQDNNSSLCVTVTYGEQKLLFAGDAEEARQAEVLSEDIGRVTLLKVPHHGVWNKNLDAFFASLSPKYAVVTSSDKNPAEEKTLTALERIGTTVFETRKGDVVVNVKADSVEISQAE